MNVQEQEENFEIDIDQEVLPEEAARFAGSFLRPIDTVARLKTAFWINFELSRLAMGYVGTLPDWDEKGELVRLGYLHTLHIKALRERIAELPGARITDRSRTPRIIREGFELLSLAPGVPEFAYAYQIVLKVLYQEYVKLRERMDPILDAPTFDALRYAQLDERDLLAWCEKYTRFPYPDQAEETRRYGRWAKYTVQVAQTMFRHTADNQADWPAAPVSKPIGPVPVVAATDPRFPIFDPTVHGEGNLLRHSSSPLSDSVKQMVYINATEMTSAESMAYLYYGVQGMPIDFYLDAARHTWDEIRHSRMGVRRLKQWGFRTEDFLWAGTQTLTTDKVASVFPEFYAMLTMIAEPCSFFKKRKSIDAFWKFGDPLSAVQSEFDIADERLHVDFGQKWGAKLFENIVDFETAASVQEKVRSRRLQQIGVKDEEVQHLLKNFPELCGFTTKELVYDRY